MPCDLAAQAPITQQAYFKASIVRSGGGFGTAVGISGDTAVVGSTDEAAYVYVREGGLWTFQARLTASNSGSGDYFGGDVAISGDTIVIGAREEDSSATEVNGNQSDNSAPSAGAAYVFIRQGTTWVQQAYLKASNARATSFFGPCAISGDTIVIAAQVESSDARGVNGDQNNTRAFAAGAAYVFVRATGVWTQQAYLKASNTEAGDVFGVDLAISGDTIVVGASGESSNATGVNGDQANNSAPGSGAAYVFVREGTGWSQQAYLKASNQGGGFGTFRAVGVSGDIIVVGAPGDSSSATGVNGNQSGTGAIDSGAAYVFARSGTTWIQQAYLKASNTGADDRFCRVAVSGRTIVVAAFFEDSNASGINGNQLNNSATDAGAAYVFEHDGANWRQRAYLKASNAGTGDWFGQTGVALSDGTALIGVHNEDSNATGVNGDQNNNSAPDSGAAYIFTGFDTRPPCTNCPPTFSLQPTNQLVLPGTNVSLAASVASTSPVHYQWRFEGSDIPHATNSSYSFANVSLTNGHGNFSVVVSNEFGTITSTNAFVFVRIRPVIVTQPVTQVVLEGRSATFTCVATGAPPIYYRWFRTGGLIFTNTTGIGVFSTLQGPATNNIRCDAFNLAGNLTGALVNLIVLPDFDRDGIADAWESQYGLNTNNAADALLDLDGDGMPNRDEYATGTNPADAGDLLKLTILPAHGITLRFPARPNIAYAVESQTNLLSTPWQTLSNVAATNLSRAIEIIDPVGSPAGKKFYRVRTPPGP
jgi:hypothetical protein